MKFKFWIEIELKSGNVGMFDNVLFDNYLDLVRQSNIPTVALKSSRKRSNKTISKQSLIWNEAFLQNVIMWNVEDQKNQFTQKMLIFELDIPELGNGENLGKQDSKFQR
jgi:hypothetical protein